MCYHISFEVQLESIKDIFPELVVDVQLELDFQTDSYVNGFDHRPQPVMHRDPSGELKLEEMLWGFLPAGIGNFEEAEKFWNGYKDEHGIWHTGFMTLNAQGEEFLSKKLYRDAALHRRCIVFIDGFYEWHHHFPIGKKGQQLKTALKYPHHVYLKDNPEHFIMLAGIWNPWKHREVDTETGEVQSLLTPTFSIVTTAANPMMEILHNSKKRMPVILTKEKALDWLRADLTENEITEIATFQFPAERMAAQAITKDFQRTTNPKEPQEYPGFKPLFC